MAARTPPEGSAAAPDGTSKSGWAMDRGSRPHMEDRVDVVFKADKVLNDTVGALARTPRLVFGKRRA